MTENNGGNNTRLETTQQQQQLRYTDRHYRCMCGLCHSTSGSALIAALEMLAVAGYLLHLTMGESHSLLRNDLPRLRRQTLIAVGVTCLVHLVALMHLYGVYLRRPWCTLPFMLGQLIGAVGLLVLGILFLVEMTVDIPPSVDGLPLPYSPKDVDVGVAELGVRQRAEPATTGDIICVVLCFLSALLFLYFFVVVFLAFRYVRALITSSERMIHRSPISA